VVGAVVGAVPLVVASVVMAVTRVALGVPLAVVGTVAVAYVAGGVVGAMTRLRGARGAEADGGDGCDCGELVLVRLHLCSWLFEVAVSVDERGSGFQSAISRRTKVQWRTCERAPLVVLEPDPLLDDPTPAQQLSLNPRVLHRGGV
jgi:hypothetical protein